MEKNKQYLTARKKYHVIYKTTCLITGKYYLGMHSTNNLNDGYIGSGKQLWRSIKKHDIENHVYTILQHLPSRLALRKREAELVNPQRLKDHMCMNLTLGGHGSWHSCNKSGANRYPRKNNLNVLASLKKATARAVWLVKNDPIHRMKISKNASAKMKLLYSRGFKNPFENKCHTDTTREKMKKIFSQTAHQQGEKNSRFGQRWVTSTETWKSKTISADEKLTAPWVLGRNVKPELEKDIKLKNKQQQAAMKIKLYSDWYEIYFKEGFDKFVSITSYQYSQPNLVAQFSKYVPDFKPQNGKRRALT